MTEKQAEKILLRSLSHSQETRVNYFFNKAIKLNLKPALLYKELLNAYDSLCHYLSKPDYEHECIDKVTGKELYPKRIIEIYRYVNKQFRIPYQKRLKGEKVPYPDIFLRDTNIEKLLLPSLDEFKAKINEAPDPKLFSFKWQPETELQELYNKMLGGKFIDMTTSFEKFKDIFTGKPTQSITPVKWTAKINLLAYFIDSAFENNKFPMATDRWATARNCFEGANNLKQLKDSYLNNKASKPKKYNEIDILF